MIDLDKKGSSHHIRVVKFLYCFGKFDIQKTNQNVSWYTMIDLDKKGIPKSYGLKNTFSSLVF